MSTNNIGFYEDLTKIIFELSSNIIKYPPYFFCCFVVHIFKAVFFKVRLKSFKFYLVLPETSPVMRKPASCKCKNKGAADQRLCFRYTDSTISLLPNLKFKPSIHYLYPYSLVCVEPGWERQRFSRDKVKMFPHLLGINPSNDDGT